MSDTLKITADRLKDFELLDRKEQLEALKDIQKIASIASMPHAEAQSVCPVTKQTIRTACGLTTCKFWVDHGWTQNCALNFMLNQQKDKLTVEQVSLLYKKSPQRVESIYKRSFKIVQRHYLKDHLKTVGAPLFSYLPGFCVACESKLQEDELNDPLLALGAGHGYCSPECKKAHPPQYYEIEKFFEAEFLKVVEVGSELFHFYYLEEILGFQPNVLRNRLEKLRDEAAKRKAKAIR